MTSQLPAAACPSCPVGSVGMHVSLHAGTEAHMAPTPTWLAFRAHAHGALQGTHLCSSPCRGQRPLVHALCPARVMCTRTCATDCVQGPICWSVSPVQSVLRRSWPPGMVSKEGEVHVAREGGAGGNRLAARGWGEPPGAAGPAQGCRASAGQGGRKGVEALGQLCQRLRSLEAARVLPWDDLPTAACGPGSGLQTPSQQRAGECVDAVSQGDAKLTVTDGKLHASYPARSERD